MDDFAAISAALHPEHPRAVNDDAWTEYLVESHPFDPGHRHWPYAYLWHFDRRWPTDIIATWVAVTERLAEVAGANAKLCGRVEVLRPLRVGRDYLLLVKPPYDGGYSTTRYGEFLQWGECQPNADILAALATLHTGMLECMRHPSNSLLDTLLHASFVRPHDQLLWDGDEGWTLYWPQVTLRQLLAWRDDGELARPPDE